MLEPDTWRSNGVLTLERFDVTTARVVCGALDSQPAATIFSIYPHPGHPELRCFHTSVRARTLSAA